jgi:tetratricopeptide (TPR) repeat protein
MKTMLKWLFIAGVITALIVVVTNKSRQRATAPAGPAPRWEPPTVAPTEPEPEVTAAEAEGMTAPEAPAEDVALDASGAEVVSELAAEPLTPAVPEQPEPEPEALAVAEDEGMAPPSDAPAEDIAVGSAGFPIISELAAADAELAMEEEFLDALEHHVAAEDVVATPEAPAEDIAASASSEPVVPEFVAPGAAESLAGEAALPDFGAMLDEAVAEVEAGSPATEQQAVAEETRDPDFLTRYFEELAATPEESETAATAATEAAAARSDAGGDEALLTSVEEALEDLEPAAIVPPPRRTAESFLDEGNVYFNVGQYGLAVERYTQAIDMDRELTAAFYNRANAHTRAGDFENALADYNRALELQPRDADALNNRGMLHLYRSNFPAALADFNGALEADPTDTTVMVNRGLAHLHGGNSAAALVDFREAAAKDTSDAAAQYGAAQASASLGNRDEALKHVTRALELDPAYAREAAADPRLALLQGDEEFLKLLRQGGARSN